MNIYQVVCDQNAASIVACGNNSENTFAEFRADPIEGAVSPVYRLNEPRSSRANFYRLNETALVYDEIAADTMDEFIEYAGELFTIDVVGVGNLTVVNVLEVCNCLNRVDSELIDGMWKESIAMNKLKFHERRVSSLSSLFKVPELEYCPVLTFSNASNSEYVQEHDFYTAYQEAELTGLKFNLLWSSA